MSCLKSMEGDPTGAGLLAKAKGAASEGFELNLLRTLTTFGFNDQKSLVPSGSLNWVPTVCKNPKFFRSTTRILDFTGV